MFHLSIIIIIIVIIIIIIIIIIINIILILFIKSIIPMKIFLTIHISYYFPIIAFDIHLFNLYILMLIY
jgi:hypothetical protein